MNKYAPGVISKFLDIFLPSIATSSISMCGTVDPHYALIYCYGAMVEKKKK